MFIKTRNRLTLLNTAIMAAFLLTFVVISFAGLTWGIIYELKQEVKFIIREEAEEQRQLFAHNQTLKQVPGDIESDRDIKGVIFYFVVDPDGGVVDTEEPVPALRQVTLERVYNWDVPEGTARIQRTVLPDGQVAVFIMTARSVYDGERLLCTIYLGKDVTAYYVVLIRLLMIFIAVALLFLILASWAGHFLAGRAMIPIKQSYTKQREFVADASHELRTPLSILLTSTDVLDGDEENRLSPFSKQVLDDMQDEIRKMSKIVGDLSTLARADAGAVQLLKEKFNIQAVAARVVRSLQTSADQKHIKLHLSRPESLFVYADRERIGQLLFILVDNAIKYTPERGQVNVRIEFGENAELFVTVQDIGIGISLEHQPHIFERFYRVDKSRSREAGGTGLGLAIAKWIVEAHGGTIKVESIPGQGSTFTVKLCNVVVVR